MVFKDGQFNGVIKFYPGPFLVAMATKFGTNWAITQSARFFASIYYALA